MDEILKRSIKRKLGRNPNIKCNICHQHFHSINSHKIQAHRRHGGQNVAKLRDYIFNIKNLGESEIGTPQGI